VFDKVDVLYTHLDPAAPTNPEPTQVQESQLTNLQRQWAGVQASQQLGHGHHNLSVSVSLSHLGVIVFNLLLPHSTQIVSCCFPWADNYMYPLFPFFLLFTHAPIPFSHPDSSYTYTNQPTDHHYS
jgi:hypothetical protein